MAISYGDTFQCVPCALRDMYLLRILARFCDSSHALQSDIECVFSAVCRCPGRLERTLTATLTDDVFTTV